MFDFMFGFRELSIWSAMPPEEQYDTNGWGYWYINIIDVVYDVYDFDDVYDAECNNYIFNGVKFHP